MWDGIELVDGFFFFEDPFSLIELVDGEEKLRINYMQKGRG